jgi:hypothetical protein
MMSNKSAEYPQGILTRENLKTFFAVSGEPGSFVYNKGHERIPENFYKSAIGDEYSIAGFVADILGHALKDPRFLDAGGNTGTPNTFTPVDIGSLTKGVFDTGDLLKGNNLECFVFQAALAAAPDFLGGTFSNVGSATSALSDTIATRLAGLSCPQLQSLDDDAFSKYPGYKKYTSYA